MKTTIKGLFYIATALVLKCTEGRYSDWEDSWEQAALKRLRRCLGAGIGFVAEERRVQGIVPDLSVRENLLLGHLAASRKFGLGYSQRKAKLNDLIQKLGLPAERLDTNFSTSLEECSRRSSSRDGCCSSLYFSNEHNFDMDLAP
jgi:hypothetical protein